MIKKKVQGKENNTGKNGCPCCRCEQEACLCGKDCRCGCGAGDDKACETKIRKPGKKS